MGGGLKDVHKRKYDRVGVLQKAWLMPRGEILSFKQFYLHRQAFILKCKKIRSKTKITTFSHASEAQLPPLVFTDEKKARERCILHMHANKMGINGIRDETKQPSQAKKQINIINSGNSTAPYPARKLKHDILKAFPENQKSRSTVENGLYRNGHNNRKDK